MSKSNVTGTVTVKIDGVTRGSLSGYFSSRPVFGQSGTVTVTSLSVGSHSIHAETESGGSWSDTFIIVAGKELFFQLQ